MSLQQQFEDAVEKLKALTKKPTDDELLELYSLYKQVTCGDCDTKKPSMLDLKRRKKWESWTNKKGVSKESAQQSYIEFVKTLQSKYS